MFDGATLLVVTGSVITILIVFVLGMNLIHKMGDKTPEYRLQSYPNRPMFPGEDRALWSKRYYARKIEEEIMYHMTGNSLDSYS